MTKCCDWCDEPATVETTDGLACEQHERELERLAELRIWQSGNPFAGEAAEVVMAEARRKGLRGPKIGPDGKIVGGTYDGMTPEQVLADRDAYNRACGE